MEIKIYMFDIRRKYVWRFSYVDEITESKRFKINVGRLNTL